MTLRLDIPADVLKRREIACVLVAWRHELGMSQKQVAQALGLTSAAIKCREHPEYGEKYASRKSVYWQQYYGANKESIVAKQKQRRSHTNRVRKEFRRNNPERRRDERLSRFGIRHADYIRMLSAQQGCCAICFTNTSAPDLNFSVDHSHATGAVRGLLCMKCNRSLGAFKDDCALLARAAHYVADGGVSPYRIELAQKRGHSTPKPKGKQYRRAGRYHSISIVDYTALFEYQQGRCAICRTDVPGGRGSFHVDHDHSSLVVRGLLCALCNIGLGNFLDEQERFYSAIAYLEKWNESGLKEAA